MHSLVSLILVTDSFRRKLQETSEARFPFPEATLTLPQTNTFTPTSNSSSGFVKYFPPLFLAQMADLMDDSSYTSSILKNTTATRKVDCVLPATFAWYHSNWKQKCCTPCLTEATFHPPSFLSPALDIHPCGQPAL